MPDILLLIYLPVFLFGTIIGSFLNVCIYRIPNHEDIVSKPSHCGCCGYRLAWYDLIPIISWFLLRGRCRKCKEKISIQYPLIEACNGVLWVITFVMCGINLTSVIYCLFMSALLVLSVIDARTYEIPFSINVFIAVLGILHLLMDLDHYMTYIIGFFLVSGIFQVCLWITKGKGMGGGDVKLMAAAGLLLGWEYILFAMIVSCLYGSVIHIIRMKLSGVEHQLAMGPYLAMGLATAIWFGESAITWYSNLIYH